MVSYQRWINISYLVFCAVLFMLFRHVTELAWDMAHFAVSADAVVAPTDLIALGVSLVCFVILMRHQRLNEFMNEVALELSKVTWPPRKESVMSAGVIVVLIGIVSMILVGFDTLWQKMVGLIVFKL